MAADLQYRIVAKDPAAHLFEVMVTIAKPAETGQAFSMPAWIPGSYKIRDLAQHVISIHAESEGQEIALTKTDKSSWIADPCAGALRVTLQVYAYDRNVRGAHLDTTHGFFDGACVFPMVAGQENARCSVEIAAPEGWVAGGWRVATSMQPDNAGRYEFGHYVARNYAELIDHPVEMGQFLIGEFEANDIPHAIAVRGHTRFDMARVCHDLARLCEAQLNFLGVPESLDRYLFILDVQANGYGGLEHRWSSALTCSRDDLPARGDDNVSDDYRKFLGLCSHEYFHLWHIKRIKPQVFSSYDLRREVYTRQLWVFEGITSYYDDLMLHRAGLISRNSYLDLLGKTITKHARNRGKSVQNVEESSFDAWTKFYNQHANSSNSIVSYYTKGSLIALALDLTIRKQTDGDSSLDDVMSKCWEEYGGDGGDMPERGIETVARSVSGLELEDFFERYVRGTGELPLKALLKAHGVTLQMRQATGSKDTGGKPAAADSTQTPWLGSRITANGRFGTVQSGSPAEKAGIAPGDEAVAIDGLRISQTNQDARLRLFKKGDAVTVSAFRDDVLMQHRVRLAGGPDDTCYLEFDEEAAEGSLRLRDGWLPEDAGKD